MAVDEDPNRGHSEEELVRLFKFERLLNEDPLSKTATLLGTIFDQSAILTVEKTVFGHEIQSLNDETSPNVDIIERNDIYRWYLCTLASHIPSMKATMIYPATEAHIRKYEKQSRRMIRETPDIYDQFVEKYVQTQKGDRIQWLYNILEYKAEKESIVYEDPDPISGFLLLPDMKWDRKTISSLYLSAILRRRDISSIRDLNVTHIPLLKKIRQQSTEAIREHWPEVAGDQLCFFFHYHPSYYHLHIHIVHTDSQSRDGMVIGKAWLLDDVIEQLSLLGPEGFKKKTITVIVGEQSDLWKKVYGKLQQL